MTKTEYINVIIDYCNENPMIRAGVFVKSRRSVFMIRDFITTESNAGNYEVCLNGASGKCVVEFKNGSTLLIGIANEYNMVGQRFHVAFIEDEVRKDIVYTYLSPRMVWKFSNAPFNWIVFA